MRMNLRESLLALIAIIMISPALAQDKATTTEVITKVHKAAQILQEDNVKALERLRDNTSEFTWKDTYVFVIDLNSGEVLANPAFREREGGNIREHLDWAGKKYGLDLCKLGSNGGGWMEYLWPLPGTDKGIRKLAYVYPVLGTSLLACSGIYDETTSLQELNIAYKQSQEQSAFAVIFEVYPEGNGKEEYLKIANRLNAELQKMPGIISVERFQSLTNKGKILSLSYWEDENSINNWRNKMAHREGQKAGHNHLFKSYRIKVSKVIRDYTNVDRKQAPEDSNIYLIPEN